MIRRRPIPKGSYQWKREPKESSLRYKIILGGAAIEYPDGRQVCQPNAAGDRLYASRVREMVQRQQYRCCLCPGRLNAMDATFEHQRRRGMHAAFRDDRIVDAEGNWINGAAHWVCNGKKG